MNYEVRLTSFVLFFVDFGFLYVPHCGECLDYSTIRDVQRSVFAIRDPRLVMCPDYPIGMAYSFLSSLRVEVQEV